MKKIIYLFIISLNYISAQTDNNYIPNITIAPPQVASLSKVEEIPVDISTGRFNYTIPIFEIQEKNLSLPINLSYNYSGLQIDETPGYAGVGWTFNIGGSIMHTINGQNDEYHEYDKIAIYKYVNNLYPYNDYSTPEGKTTINHFLESVANGLIDGQADKYNVNIGNINCSFYLDKDNNPIFLKNENYKLSGNSSIGFTLTDDQGINYVFNLAQTANKVTENDQYDYISAFLITEINFPNTSNKINFEYGNPEQHNSFYKSQSLIKTTDVWGIYQNDYSLRTNTTTTILNTTRLNKIITSNYTVNLEYNVNPEDSSVAVISSLQVKNNLNELVKDYDFTYSNWVGNRTNLLNVKYGNEVINQMEYDMSISYPTPTMNNYYLKKDLWGYYTANATPVNYLALVEPYANSTIKPDFGSTKIGALKKITYQTKGYSLIEYEPNNAYIKSSDYNFPYDADVTNITTINSHTIANNGGSNENTFIVDSIPTEINIISTLTNHTQFNSYEDRSADAVIFKEGELNNPIYTFSQNWLQEGNWIPPQLIFTQIKKIVINEIGTYHIKTNSTIGASASLNVTLKVRPEFFNQTVGGIRVKEIKNCDFNNQCITSHYNYIDSNRSSGLLLQSPKFYSGYHIQDNLLCSSSYYERKDFYNYTSIYPLSVFRGSPVLYKVVEKIDMDGTTSKGKIIFSYYGNSIPNSLQGEESYFEVGRLDTKVVKDQSNISLTTLKNNYLTSKRDNTIFMYDIECKEVHQKRAQMFFECGLGYPRPFIDFQVTQLKHEAKNYVLESEINTINLNGQILTNEETLEYNLNTGYLKKRTSNNSIGETLETKYFYPQDPEMAAEPIVGELINENIVSTPLMTQSFRNNIKLSETTTKYASYPSSVASQSLLLPQYIYAGKENNLEKKITYDSYDTKGNILQYTPENGIPTSIIWGYNKTLPVAKIENATNAQVQTALGMNLSDVTEANMSIINALRASLPNAMVTTYTHIPLVGVSTITDPKGDTITYIYDSFNRLKEVKDKNGNKLSENQYHYRP